MKLIFTAVVLVVTGMVLFELAMQPDAGERMTALVIFGLMASGIAAIASVLPRLARRLPSLKITVVLLGVATVLILVLATVFAGRQMFISDHDLSLFLVFMAFGVVAALAFGLTVSGPLTEDLTKISDTSSAIASGDLGARTGVLRVDEAGQLARDVDVMARALQESEEARRREESSRRALFAAISHDLRTPLASMRAAVEALNDGMADEPERYQRSLEADVDALTRLVDDVYLLARLDSNDMDLQVEEVDLTEIADEAIEVFRPIASAQGVRLRLEADSRVLTIGSTDALARVVRNLIDNAVRHSPDDGDVVVAVSNGDGAWCRVTDQGPGFSTDFVEHAFERFSRDDVSRARNRGGAGLGLAIARGYVIALDGDIWAEPGPGGTVSFRLPPANTIPSNHRSGPR